MAGYAHGENNFSDDDLDDLPIDALAELEHNAIQFTQATNTQARPKPAPAPSSDYGDDFDDEDLDDAVVIDESRSTPAIVTAFSRNNPGPPTERDQFRQQRYGNSNALANRQRPDIPTYQRNTAPLSSNTAARNNGVTLQPESQVGVSDDAEELRRQLGEVTQALCLYPARLTVYTATKEEPSPRTDHKCQGG